MKDEQESELSATTNMLILVGILRFDEYYKDVLVTLNVPDYDVKSEKSSELKSEKVLG